MCPGQPGVATSWTIPPSSGVPDGTVVTPGILVFVPGQNWGNTPCFFYQFTLTWWWTSPHCWCTIGSSSLPVWKSHRWILPLSACNHLLDQPEAAQLILQNKLFQTKPKITVPVRWKWPECSTGKKATLYVRKVGRKLLFLQLSTGCNVELCSTANIAQGQYWFLFLLHGFIPPWQYGVLLHWLEEDWPST